MRRSTELLQRGQNVIPGGVNSPVRAFGAVGGIPRFVERGLGARITDVDGREAVDLVGSWGPLIVGHAHPDVERAAVEALQKGSSFGAPTEREIELAECVAERVDSVEKLRLCSSGTEATMHAIRLARGATQRPLVVKMEGCYHGAHDAMLVQAGSGVATFSEGRATASPATPGVPAEVAQLTCVLPFNDLNAAQELFAAHGEAIAAVILEPIAGNMGCVAPVDGYLQGLRELCTQRGALLILDEVMTGFRVSSGGAQTRFDVHADLTCFGKVLGGGYPLAAFGGAGRLMDKLAPTGPIYQGGTLSGNPVAVAAGLETLRLLDASAYQTLEDTGARIEAGIADAVAKARFSFARVGSMFTIFCQRHAPRSFEDVQRSDFAAFARLFHAALDKGVYLPPSQYEAAFLSTALTDDDIEQIIAGLNHAIAVAGQPAS